MKPQCLPFAQIPHTSRLFLDYLSYAPSVRGMYPRSPLFSEWVKEEAQRVDYDSARRGKVSEILERQNRAWVLLRRLWRILSGFGEERWRRLRGSKLVFSEGRCFRFSRR